MSLHTTPFFHLLVEVLILVWAGFLQGVNFPSLALWVIVRRAVKGATVCTSSDRHRNWNLNVIKYSQ